MKSHINTSFHRGNTDSHFEKTIYRQSYVQNLYGLSDITGMLVNCNRHILYNLLQYVLFRRGLYDAHLVNLITILTQLVVTFINFSSHKYI